MERVSILKTLGLGDKFGYTLLIFSLTLILTPYFPGVNFGPISIPRLGPNAYALKYIGLISLIVTIAMHANIWHPIHAVRVAVIFSIIIIITLLGFYVVIDTLALCNDFGKPDIFFCPRGGKSETNRLHSPWILGEGESGKRECRSNCYKVGATCCEFKDYLSIR